MQKSEYDAMFKSEEKMWWYVGLRDILSFYIKRNKKKNLLILDAGCGTGKNMEVFISEGYRVHGIDISKVAISYCRIRGIKDVREGFITNIPFKKNLFDIVISTDVLGALKSDEEVKKAFLEFHRVLKPKGLLIIHCAALEFLRSQHDEVIRFRKRFTKKELEEMADHNQWKEVKSSYRIFFLFPIIAMVKIFKKLTGENKKVATTDQYIPPKIINLILTWIQLLENRIIHIMNFPIGSSLLLVVRKK